MMTEPNDKEKSQMLVITSFHDQTQRKRENTIVFDVEQKFENTASAPHLQQKGKKIFYVNEPIQSKGN